MTFQIAFSPSINS